MKKVILHLCADIGSDSRYFDLDPDFEVIKVGEAIGVENFSYDGDVHGVIANPVCTKFSNVNQHRSHIDDSEGMFLVDHCLRIIEEVKPKFCY
jgi:site-specific DNA-cytosine methylase